MAADDAMDDIDIEDNLWRAASDGDMALVSSLLREEDGGVNAKDEYGLTPLMAAVSYGHTELAVWLLDRGANVRDKDKAGNTALHFVDSVECLRLLLDKGANPVQRNKDGETALDAKAEELKLLEEEADIDVEEADNGKLAALVDALRTATTAAAAHAGNSGGGGEASGKAKKVKR